MPWFEIVDPRGAAGHRFGAVVELPVYAGMALRNSGRVIPAVEPVRPTADKELRESKPGEAEKLLNDGFELALGLRPIPDVADQIDEALGAPTDGLDDKTVAELKAMLVEASKSTVGKKAELIARLRGEEE